jgi:hypothetical protein
MYLFFKIKIFNKNTKQLLNNQVYFLTPIKPIPCLVRLPFSHLLVEEPLPELTGRFDPVGDILPVSFGFTLLVKTYLPSILIH